MRQDRYRKASRRFSLSIRTCLEMSAFGLKLEMSALGLKLEMSALGLKLEMSAFGLKLEISAENPEPKHVTYIAYSVFKRHTLPLHLLLLLVLLLLLLLSLVQCRTEHR